MLQNMTWSSGLVLTLAVVAQAQNQSKAPPGLERAYDEIKAELPDVFLLNKDNPQKAQLLNEILPQNLNAQLENYYLLLENADQGSGLSLIPVDEAARVHLKLPKGQGLIATSVLPQGPAAHAGICQNDILLTLDDVPLSKPENLEERLKTAGDKTLELLVLHRGQKKTIQIQPKVKVTFGPVQPALPEFWIGVSVTPVEPALRAQLQIPAGQGLMTTSVFEDSPAAKAGFKVNDILLTLNGKHLLDQAELSKLVQDNGDKSLAVEIVREGSRSKIEVKPERRKGLKILASSAQHTGSWNIVRPGAVIPGNQTGFIAIPEVNWNTPFDAVEMMDSSKSNSAQPHSDPPANRLDVMAGEIKELRKAVEELSKALKDRK